MATLDESEAITPLTDAQQQKVYQPDAAWSDSFAAKVAVQDFQAAEAYRSSNADWRWANADELYQGYTQQKYWEGTKIPRASIPMYVAFEQVESMLPKIVGGVFNEAPWFQADPDLSRGTTAAQAREWQSHIESQLDHGRFIEQARRQIKDGLIYGNGILKQGWDLRESNRLEWVITMKPKTEALGMLGQAQGFTGWERLLEKKTAKKIINRPTFDRVLLPDFYIDPNCTSPQVTDGRFCCERKLITVDTIDSYRSLKEFNIPDRGQLIEWAKNKASTQGDNTKAGVEQWRLGGWSPQIDTTVDPGGLRLEVIAYTTEARRVWVINREYPILNCPNTSEFMGYYDFFYADVPGRFYAMGVCDVVEGEQRLQGSIINARLDELSLSIHRPVVKKRGLSLPTYQLRSRPGQVIEVDEPATDYLLMKTEGITQSAYLETQASDIRVQQITGQSDLVNSGTQGSGGNSASRTATGIGAQVQASASRIQHIVKTYEDTVLEPCLNDLVKNNQLYPPIGTKQADIVALSNVYLSMRASAKMLAKQQLLQTLPLMLQTLANPGFVAELAKHGQAPNFGELMTMITEMTGYNKRADLIGPIDPKKLEAMNQPPPADMLHYKMQQDRIAGQDAIQQKKMTMQFQIDQKTLEQEHDLEREKLAIQIREKQAEIETQRKIAADELALKREIEMAKLALDAQVKKEEVSVKREQMTSDGETDDNKLLMELASKVMQKAEADNAKRADVQARQAKEAEAKAKEAAREKAFNEVQAELKKVRAELKDMKDDDDGDVEVERDGEGNIAKLKTKRKVVVVERDAQRNIKGLKKVKT